MALRAQAALYHASPLFNPNNDVELWRQAALANKELIDACEAKGKKLASTYSNLWSSDFYSNSDVYDELLFARRVAASTSVEQNNFPVGYSSDSVFANAEYARQFLVGIYSLQYYGLPFLNTSRIQHVCNPYTGKVDALTDCWHMGWNGAAVYGQYYAGALTANVSRNDYLDGPLFSNPAALKQNVKFLKKGGVLIYDEDTFIQSELAKAKFATLDPFTEMGIADKYQLVAG